MECFLSHLKLAVTSLEIIPTNAIPCHATVHSFFLVCHRSTLVIPPMTTRHSKETQFLKLRAAQDQTLEDQIPVISFKVPADVPVPVVTIIFSLWPIGVTDGCWKQRTLCQKLVIERPTVARRAKLKRTLEHSNTFPNGPVVNTPLETVARFDLFILGPMGVFRVTMAMGSILRHWPSNPQSRKCKG